MSTQSELHNEIASSFTRVQLKRMVEQGASAQDILVLGETIALGCILVAQTMDQTIEIHSIAAELNVGIVSRWHKTDARGQA